jgi:hypothetical protein
MTEQEKQEINELLAKKLFGFTKKEWSQFEDGEHDEWVNELTGESLEDEPNYTENWHLAVEKLHEIVNRKLPNGQFNAPYIPYFGISIYPNIRNQIAQIEYYVNCKSNPNNNRKKYITATCNTTGEAVCAAIAEYLKAVGK